ncbi:MAG: penicillin-binding protein, partial [Acidimicrobiales bacterium]
GPSAALAAVDPTTGAVTALVGGRDFYSGRPGSQLDLATQSERQGGSTFKPFVLTTALEHGIGLNQEFAAPARISIPITGGTWNVQNYPGEPVGTMNLVKATIFSDNVVYAQLMMRTGPSSAVSVAARLGITTPLQANPAAVLGTNPVNPLEMADAYATLINGGVHNSPFMVSEVDGPHGRVLYRHHRDPHRVVPAAVAYTVDGVLQQVVDQGTGVEARIGRPVAGKTGTTDNWADAWFVGGTPQLASAVWVGYPGAERPMVPPATPFQITGGTWAARIFQLYVSTALADQPVIDFPNPPSTAAAAIDGPAGLPVAAVVGFPVAQATTELDGEGFVVQTDTVTNGEYPPGYVVSQSPAGGVEAPGGSAVVLQVSG